MVLFKIEWVTPYTAEVAMIRRDRWMLFCIGVISTIIPGCQQYGFEEVPSTVITENHTTYVLTASPLVDILFVVDNSGSMTGKQQLLAESFGQLSSILDTTFGAGNYNIAVVTTGMKSQACQPCVPGTCQNCDQQCTPSASCVNCDLYGSQCIPHSEYSCINGTGENGRFQDYLGYIDSQFDYLYKGEDPTCRIVTSDNQGNCFYNSQQEGIVFVGDKGCGYERGLEPIRMALSPNLLGSYNAGFLRKEAMLVVIVVSDEEDCGIPGDVEEGLPNIGGNICYYASKGQNPDGSAYTGNPLEPIDTYYDFLLGLKGNNEEMVKFAGIIGVHVASYDANGKAVVDPADPLNTINYTADGQIKEACDTISLGCNFPVQAYCTATPGTRYIALAKKFGANGFIDTICQTDFSNTMAKVGTFIGCPTTFTLSQPILDPALVNILVNGVAVPSQSWTYDKVLNTISFVGGYNPCSSVSGGKITIELIYATK